MLMLRTLRYPLTPTKAQEAGLEHQLEYYRTLYNAALEERRNAWKLCRKSITAYDQCGSWTQIRGEDEEAQSMSSWTGQQLFRRLDNAYAAFFRRCKSGEKPGYPRFKGRDRFKSFDIGASHVFATDDTSKKAFVNVPKIGRIRFKRYRPLQGTVKNVTIKRENDGKWFVLFQCDLGPAPQKVAPDTLIGIDLGLTTFVATDDGQLIDNPKFAAKAQAKLAQRQQRLALKQKGSKSRKRAKRLVSKSHTHIKNQRKDHAWKTARALLAQCDAIAFEDLNVKKMLEDKERSFSISDAAWRQLINCLICKAEEAGKWAIGVDPRMTSQKCSECGKIVPKTLADRTHKCPYCGLVLDRDVNAARNVKALGLSVLSKAMRLSHCGSGEAGCIDASSMTPCEIAV